MGGGVFYWSSLIMAPNRGWMGEVEKILWRQGKPALCTAGALAEPKKVSRVLEHDVMLSFMNSQ